MSILTKRSRVRGIFLAAGVITGFVVLAATAPQPELVISSVSADGANLVVTADIPAGIQTVRLETRDALDGAWNPHGVASVPAGGGPLGFSVPKPEGERAFFRLIAIPQTQAQAAPATTTQTQNVKQAAASSTLNYVAIEPLGADGKEAVLHIKGVIDGSDKIRITRGGIFWSHLHWEWPHGSVSVNGAQWKPEDKNFVTTRGATQLLPGSYSLENVTLEKIKGRDVVCLERDSNGALIAYVNDAFAGDGDYEFKIHFNRQTPAEALKQSTPAKLKITAEIDGSDVLRIDADGATIHHNAYKYPADLRLNGIVWPASATNPALKNSGATAFLPAGVDFSTAKITARKGRDLATLWAEKDFVRVQFADNPLGSDRYELEISFGQ